MFTRRLFVAAAGLFMLTACQPAARNISSADAGAPAIGGPFQLIDADGKPVTEAVLQGKWSAIYFGYTACPDVCPTTLQALKEGLGKLGADGSKVQTIFISVDPEHDTPAVMKAYIDNSAFPAGMQGLTGTPDQIARTAKAYKVFYQKAEGGLVQHQSIIFLMNPKGQLARPLTGEMSPDQIASQIGDALRQGRG